MLEVEVVVIEVEIKVEVDSQHRWIGRQPSWESGVVTPAGWASMIEETRGTGAPKYTA